MDQQPESPAFKTALFYWLKLGCISFGGPAGQIAIMHNELVEKRRWINEHQFADALGFCMLLPGPEAQQLATYLGWRLHGIKGGLTAGILFILPSILIMLALSILYVRYGNYTEAGAILKFLRPAVLAVIVSAFFKLIKPFRESQPHLIATFIAFVGMTFLSIPFPLLIVAALVAGWLFPSGTNNRIHQLPLHSTHHTSGIKVFVAGIVLLLLPMAFVVTLKQDFAFWSTLALFFTKTACITFGGAYAVLPYVAQESVNHYGWLSSTQMIDGLALGETTPGPLVMVLSFVGFMAGFTTYNHNILFGSAALLFTVWYTFLPGFVFVLTGAPYVTQISSSVRMQGILRMVSATVAGVILNLGYVFGKSVLLNFEGNLNLQSLAWFAIVLLVAYKKWVSVPLIVLLSAAAGLLFQYIKMRMG